MLVIQDSENIAKTTGKMQLRLDQELLASAIHNRCKESRFLAFASGEEQNHPIGGPYPEPWELKFNQIEIVPKMGELQRRGNSDNLILFTVGNMIRQSNVDTILLLTGDGDLACDLSWFVKQACPKPISVLALSVPSSTSHRLTSRRSGLFAGHFNIGHDFLVHELFSNQGPSLTERTGNRWRQQWCGC